MHELIVGKEDLFEIKRKMKHRKCFHNPAQGSKWQKINSTNSENTLYTVNGEKHVENSNPRCMKLFYLHDFC